MNLLLAIFLTIIWKPSPDQDVAGYRIYWRTSEPSHLQLGGPWYFSLDAGKTNRCEFSPADNVFYDFVSTCYTASGIESDFSNEVFFINARGK